MVSTDSVQGIFGRFTDACTSLRGKLWITYMVGLQKSQVTGDMYRSPASELTRGVR